MKPTLEAIEEQAAAWRARAERGLSASDESVLEEWLEADPRHASAYHAIDRMWDCLDQVKFAPRADELSAELKALRPVARRGLGFWAGGLAAAAALAIGYVQWYRPNFHHATVRTAVGEISRMELPDGSTVLVNTNTRLSVRFSRSHRRISLLHGEAHFVVSRDPGRPFVVSANDVQVQAVGTAFAVRNEAGAVNVLVTDGKVRLEQAAVANRADAPRLLVAGERAAITRGLAVSRLPEAGATIPAPPSTAAIEVTAVPEDELTRSLAWQERRLVFVSAPLSEIVAEFNRYNDRKLVVADPDLAGNRFGGTFQATEPMTFAQLLQSGDGVPVSETPERILLGKSK